MLQARLCNGEAEGLTTCWQIGLFTVKTAARNFFNHLQAISKSWNMDNWGNFFNLEEFAFSYKAVS